MYLFLKFEFFRQFLKGYQDFKLYYLFSVWLENLLCQKVHFWSKNLMLQCPKKLTESKLKRRHWYCLENALTKRLKHWKNLPVKTHLKFIPEFVCPSWTDRKVWLRSENRLIFQIILVHSKFKIFMFLDLPNDSFECYFLTFFQVFTHGSLRRNERN